LNTFRKGNSMEYSSKFDQHTRKTFTFEEIKSYNPCADYDFHRLQKLFNGRARLNCKQILNLDIPSLDKAWVLIRLLSKKERKVFAYAALRADKCTHPKVTYKRLVHERWLHVLFVDTLKRISEKDSAIIFWACFDALAELEAGEAMRLTNGNVTEKVDKKIEKILVKHLKKFGYLK